MDLGVGVDVNVDVNVDFACATTFAAMRSLVLRRMLDYSSGEKMESVLCSQVRREAMRSWVDATLALVEVGGGGGGVAPGMMVVFVRWGGLGVVVAGLWAPGGLSWGGGDGEEELGMGLVGEEVRRLGGRCQWLCVTLLCEDLVLRTFRLRTVCDIPSASSIAGT